MLRATAKRLVSRCVRHDLVWKCVSSLPLRLKLTRVALQCRLEHEEGISGTCRPRILDQWIKEICPDLVVMNGIFRGMKYARAQSFGSTLYPKLIGCYEKELQPCLKDLAGREYTDVVDVGCAEGYYAVGLALLFPKATIHAYDTNHSALQVCLESARVNGVADRLITRRFFDRDELAKFSRLGRCLVFSDCEGYEKQLFTSESAEFLATHDAIIETHDGLDATISSGICNAFTSTHDIQRVKIQDDFFRLATCTYPQLVGLDLLTTYLLVRECRCNSSEWIVLKSSV